MSAGEYLGGAALLALMLGSTGVAAWRVARLSGPMPLAGRMAQAGVLWAAGIFIVHVVPGALGILGRGPVAVASVVLVGVTLLGVRGRPAGRGEVAYPPAFSPSGTASWVIAVVAGAGCAVVVAAMGLSDGTTPPGHVDIVSFHLPNVARWIQSSTLWQVDDFIPDRSPGNYPQTGDVFSLAAILPWRDDFAVRFVNYPLLLMAAASAYALARELRAPAATAVTATAAFLAIPLVSWGALAGLADTAMLATFGPGVYLLVRHARTREPLDLIVAGVALGLAFGTRWYAVPAVVVVVGVWLAGVLIVERRPRAALRATTALGGLVIAFGGFWLLRNWVQSGNPLYPVRVAPLGLTVFDAPRDVFREIGGFTLADYATDPSVWKDYLWPGFLRGLGWTSVLLWVGLAGAGLTALARRDRQAVPVRERAVVICLASAAVLIALLYAVTPYSAAGVEDQPVLAWVNARYVVPALLPAAALTAWLAVRAGRWRPVVELVLAAGVLDGLRRIDDLPGTHVGPGWVVAAALALAGVVLAVGVARYGRPVRPARPLLLGAAVVLALAAVVAGRAYQHAYDRDRYAGVSAPFDYIDGKAPAGRRIGWVGEGWGTYPFFGPRLRNDVRFVGRRVDGTYRNYRRAGQFRAALERGRYDLVVFYFYSSIDPTLPERQERWLKQLGYRPVASGANPYGYNSRATIYRPPG